MFFHKNEALILITILVVSQLGPLYTFCLFVKLHKIVTLKKKKQKFSMICTCVIIEIYKMLH